MLIQHRLIKFKLELHYSVRYSKNMMFLECLSLLKIKGEI